MTLLSLFEDGWAHPIKEYLILYGTADDAVFCPVLQRNLL